MINIFPLPVKGTIGQPCKYQKPSVYCLVIPRVKIYLTGVDLADEMDSLDHLVSSLTNATDIVCSVDNWWKTLKNSLPKNRSEVTHEIFNKKLTQFLHG